MKLCVWQFMIIGSDTTPFSLESLESVAMTQLDLGCNYAN